VESHRVAPGRIRQGSRFLRLDVADHELSEELQEVGIEAEYRRDELTLLWTKLAAVAPIALATTALARPVGDARADPLFGQCREEALRVAAAVGAAVDADAVRSFLDQAPPQMRSSMQEDASSGRPIDLDGIAGPIIRTGISHDVPTTATSALVEQIRGRLEPKRP
jgi:2-dehydropantoate 2-reductase